MGEIRLLDIRDTALDATEVTDSVADPHAGGVVTFVGAVRDHDDERAVADLSYSAHPTALDRLREVAQEVAASPDVVAVAAVHRIGDLAVGEAAVVVAASAAHRGQAFAAASALIDRLKETVPIWKHQRFADGDDEWVGTP